MWEIPGLHSANGGKKITYVFPNSKHFLMVNILVKIKYLVLILNRNLSL